MNERFVIIEVGSTNTKAYLYKEDNITDLGYITIEFKRHFKEANRITDEDKECLFKFIKNIKEEHIYVFGTSIFRNLSENEKEEWKKEFKINTGLDFKIVTSDMENEYTVYGVTASISYKGKIAVMIGGGGSTELSIVENGKIIEKCNYDFGAIDVTNMYPDLKDDYAISYYSDMVNSVKKLVNIPKNKADLLVLAGGDFIYYYEELKYPLEKNKFYNNSLQPYSLDTKTMDELDMDFFYNKSLVEIGKKTNNELWWYGARGMRLCVKALVDTIDAKYIIPTRISMVYGLANKIKNKEL